ncbi:MAG: phosphoribosyl synthetase-associated domain-containing protein [Olpidium bornovanus]|uniref:Phosphoribosyl synthetase-associated domain-containing protein n=1 Tax=Olpidium bornovanus TaxID=278681 RepID=A0A8H8DJT6_9FUNG|nr:MAG: phosphoribosyl synthetase-associated domain-containing protein [Olpidium bornovanus]
MHSPVRERCQAPPTSSNTIAEEPETVDRGRSLQRPGQSPMPPPQNVRLSGKSTTKSIGLTLIGDVTNKVVFILEDIIDGVQSFLDAADHAVDCGASRVYLVATHGILSGDALSEIEACNSVHRVSG